MEVIGIGLVIVFLVFAIWSGISAQQSNNYYLSELGRFNDIESQLDFELEDERKYGSTIDYPALLARLEGELFEALKDKERAYDNRFNNKYYNQEPSQNKLLIDSDLKIAELKYIVLERDILKIKELL